MTFKNIANIAGSAMAAQTVRMNTVASNLSNTDAASNSEATAYHARKPVFATLPGETFAVNDPSGRVQVLDVVQSTESVRKVHEPDHPMADTEGMVYYSNVNAVAEMTDMMSATRAFETNVEVLVRVRSMQQALLKLGEG